MSTCACVFVARQPLEAPLIRYLAQATYVLYRPRHRRDSSNRAQYYSNALHEWLQQTQGLRDVFKTRFYQASEPRNTSAMRKIRLVAPLRLIDSWVSNPGRSSSPLSPRNALLKSSLTSNGRRVTRYDATPRRDDRSAVLSGKHRNVALRVIRSRGFIFILTS